MSPTEFAKKFNSIWPGRKIKYYKVVFDPIKAMYALELTTKIGKKHIVGWFGDKRPTDEELAKGLAYYIEWVRVQARKLK